MAVGNDTGNPPQPLQDHSIAAALEPSPDLRLDLIGVVSTLVEDGPNKVFIGGLPQSANEEQVRARVGAFGALKSFNLAVDKETGVSKGFAFCEF